MMRANRSALAGILAQRCPRCRSGRIFAGSILWMTGMHEHCPVCDLRFERESGYFLGAMYIGYGLALVTIAILTAVLFVLTPWHLRTSIIVAIIVFLPFGPLLTHMARVLWIYLDQSIDPDRS
jgi:uncharacterized protein (DUF983 family)